MQCPCSRRSLLCPTIKELLHADAICPFFASTPSLLVCRITLPVDLDLIHDRTSALIPAVSNKDRLIILGIRMLLPNLKSLPLILLAAADLIVLL